MARDVPWEEADRVSGQLIFTSTIFIKMILFFSFLAALGFEIRTSRLQGRRFYRLSYSASPVHGNFCALGFSALSFSGFSYV